MATFVVAYLGACSEYFAVAGAVTISYIALKICWSLLKCFRTYVVGQFSAIDTFLRSKGSWAVVTGATDGIGKAYVQQLASSGLNIVLISRTESKLKDVAAEIEKQYSVKTKIIAADFSNGMSIYDGIQAGLQGLDIGVLVNNVGLSFDYPEYFLEVPDKEQVYMKLMYVNCTSVTMMSSIVMPGMVERKKGVVINISSAAGLNPTPLLSVYSACKAYVTSLTASLLAEYENKGIQVQCVNPYFVCSNMSKVRRPSLFIPSATTYVKSALHTLAFESQTLGYWPHALMHWVVGALPIYLVKTLSFNGMLGARRKAKRKMEAKKTN